MAATYLLDPVGRKRLTMDQLMGQLTMPVSRASRSFVRYLLLFLKIKTHLVKNCHRACQVWVQGNVLVETPDPVLPRIAAT